MSNAQSNTVVSARTAGRGEAMDWSRAAHRRHMHFLLQCPLSSMATRAHAYVQLADWVPVGELHSMCGTLGVDIGDCIALLMDIVQDNPFVQPWGTVVAGSVTELVGISAGDDPLLTACGGIPAGAGRIPTGAALYRLYHLAREFGVLTNSATAAERARTKKFNEVIQYCHNAPDKRLAAY